MRTVLKDKDIVRASAVDTDKYYGVDFGFARKGYITSIKIFVGPFAVRCFGSVTVGNEWGEYTRKTLQETVENLLNENLIVYEFDSPQELGKWLLDL